MESNVMMEHSVNKGHLQNSILIIDDDQDVLEAIASALTIDNQFNVNAFTDPTSAIESLNDFQPDYALIDIKLGSSNGLDLIHILKKRIPGISCIIMTAHRDAEYAVKALRNGADEYLFKPIEPENLRNTLIDIKNKGMNEIDHPMRILLEESSELIFLLNSEGILVELTKNTLDFSGADKEDVVGVPFHKTFWWNHSEDLQKNICETINKSLNGEQARLEVKIPDKDGNNLWYDFRVRPLIDSAGNTDMIIVEGHDITKHKMAEQQLTLLAHSDPLTGLANRASLENQLSQVIAHSSRNKLNFALMFIDIDNFKKYNDAYGHQRGDELLVEISEHIKNCAREEDIVARIGGDEFVVVLASAETRADALIIAKRINRVVPGLHYEGQRRVVVSTSIGLAFYPGDGRDVKTLLESADKAMYKAKKAGKNKYKLSRDTRNEESGAIIMGAESGNCLQKNIRKIRILIVDDDRDILDSLKDVLQLINEDYEIKTAESAEQAKTISSHFRPDIALLDIKLGQDSGLDLVPQLKKDMEELVCIMMTAYRNADYAVTAVRFGANDYLYKPIEPKRLIKTVERAVEHINLKRDMEESDRRFKAVFEQTFQWIILLDYEGRIIETNEESLNFSELDLIDVVDCNLWNAPWWDGSPSLKNRIKGIIKRAQKGEFVREEIGIKNMEGENVTLDLSMKPIQSIHKEVLHIIVECRDVTERKNTENSLLEARENLEGRVLERTTELEKAKKQAEKANEAKSELLARMNHELRTPLNAVLGFGQLLRLDNENLQDEQKEAIESVISGGENLLKLVNEVLDITAADSGNLDLFITDISINDSLRNVISLVSPLANQNEVTINEYKADDIFVLADPHRLNQILLNLFENAIKFNQNGGSIDITVDEINAGYLRVCIIDNGVGIRLEDQKRLFDPFNRVGGSSGQVKGVGIGLAISKKLVELMGGSIGCTSEFGSGSTFWFELPLVEAENDDLK